MPSIDTKPNPVSILAFVFSCLGCILTVAAIFLVDWWTYFFSDGRTAHYGVWTNIFCSKIGDCQSSSATELAGGQEVAFVSKIFITLGGFLAVLAVVLHVIYFLLRHAMVRTIAIFFLGAAGIFGLMSAFCFLGYYHTLSGDTSLGVAFYLGLIGAFLCLLAAAFTAWASVRKITGFGATEMDD
ncbi:uncharacterized protein LOC106012811 [Aplysia californica]|uniref:Uncharacterized protein LOC106012811 n=1 Tax=Aplysia californica TaxID=6500 RepID=A0ABM1A7H4_APLCA|nr:uncharacterized protein LOC106012811 [Aplysia californica]